LTVNAKKMNSPQKLASNLYQRRISDLPEVILALENGTQFLSNLASQTGLEDNVFPPDFVDEFDDADQIMFCCDDDDLPMMSYGSSGNNMSLTLGSSMSQHSSDKHNTATTLVHNNSQQHLSQHPHQGFKHDVQTFITKIISLENSMINVLEDLLLYAESRWNIAPYVRNDKGTLFDFYETDSQNSLDDASGDLQDSSALPAQVRQLTRGDSTTSLYYNSDTFATQKADFYQLLHEFESQTDLDDIYESGVKIHSLLHLNEHLDKVQKFYAMVRGLKDVNEDYTRANGFDLSKERASALLEDGEKLERFYDRVVDKVAQFQNAMSGLNSLLGLM